MFPPFFEKTAGNRFSANFEKWRETCSPAWCSLPLDLLLARSGEIIHPLVGGVGKPYDPPPVPLGGVAVAPELQPRGDGEPRDRGGGEGGGVRLGPEGVEHEVGAEDEVALGGGGGAGAAGGAEHKPAAVDGGGVACGHLEWGGAEVSSPVTIIQLFNNIRRINVDASVLQGVIQNTQLYISIYMYNPSAQHPPPRAYV